MEISDKRAGVMTAASQNRALNQSCSTNCLKMETMWKLQVCFWDSKHVEAGDLDRGDKIVALLAMMQPSPPKKPTTLHFIVNTSFRPKSYRIYFYSITAVEMTELKLNILSCTRGGRIFYDAPLCTYH